MNSKNAMKVSAMILAMAALGAVNAAPSLSGSVEAGYNMNLTGPKGAPGMVNNFHSYDYRTKTFLLNNAHLAIAGSDSATGLGYDVETDYGSDASANALTAVAAATPSKGLPGYALDLQEAYATWAFGPGKAIGLKMGKYATYEGIEVIEGGANPTITRGLLFGLAEPLTHTGMEVNYAAGKIDAHVGLINGWDQGVDMNNAPGIIAKVGLNMGDLLALSLSGIWGSETTPANDNMRQSYDATALTKAIPKVDLWLQFNYGMEAKAAVDGSDASWLGIGAQPVVHLNDWLALGLRYEFFSDNGRSRTIGFMPATALPATTKDLSLQDISIAPTVWLTKTTQARVEWRMDLASEKVLLDSDNKATDSQMEVAADFIIGF